MLANAFRKGNRLIKLNRNLMNTKTGLLKDQNNEQFIYGRITRTWDIEPIVRSKAIITLNPSCFALPKVETVAGLLQLHIK